jgi:hypothetical protein
LYEIVGLGLVRALKVGYKTVIETSSLLAYMATLPEANINPPVKKRAISTSETPQPAVRRSAERTRRSIGPQTPARRRALAAT